MVELPRCSSRCACSPCAPFACLSERSFRLTQMELMDLTIIKFWACAPGSALRDVVGGCETSSVPKRCLVARVLV